MIVINIGLKTRLESKKGFQLIRISFLLVICMPIKLPSNLYVHFMFLREHKSMWDDWLSSDFRTNIAEQDVSTFSNRHNLPNTRYCEWRTPAYHHWMTDQYLFFQPLRQHVSRGRFLVIWILTGHAGRWRPHWQKLCVLSCRQHVLRDTYEHQHQILPNWFDGDRSINVNFLVVNALCNFLFSNFAELLLCLNLMAFKFQLGSHH